VSARCPSCGQPVGDANSAYGNVCRHCGTILKTSAPVTTNAPASGEPLQPRRPPLQQKNRGLLWLAFWLLFLGTPFTPLINELMSRTLHMRLQFLNQGVTLIGGIAGGALGAGFILARLHSHSTTQLVLRGILFSIGILLFYATIAFVGCVVLMKVLKNV